MTIDEHLAEELMPTQESQRAVKREYVLGFCFMSYNTEVVLIRKTKPAWQKGLLNGVGGRIEPTENPMEAMIREWHEETGTFIADWHRFVTMAFSGAVVHVFKCHLSGSVPVKSVTVEPVYILSVCEAIERRLTIPNLKWLIPMALHDSQTEKPHWKGAPTLYYP